MGSKWREVSLGEISEKIGDGIHGTPVYNDSGDYYFINGSNLSDNSIKITDTTKRVDHNEFLKHRKELGDNTVLVSINGTIGNTALYNNEDIILGKSACYINLKDCISKYFILYILSGYLFQEYIQRCSTGSTIKNVSLKMMRDFRFLMPESKEVQEKVVHIIQKVDERRRLNNAQNKTLEQMSQTLFKSWFVDFDPVIDNALDAGNPIPKALQSRAELRQKLRNSADFKPLPADIRALFPAEFEETVLGWVPRGWKEGSITDIAFINSTSWGTKNQPDYVNYVDLSNAKDGIISSIENIPFEDAPSRARRILKKNDLIFGLVRPANRSFAYVHVDGLTGSTGFAVVRAKNTIYKNFIYYFVTYDKNVEELARIADGGAYPAIKPDDICSLPLIIPPEEIVQRFDESTSRFRDLMNNSLVQNDYLTALRDTLLPKLISGELSLEELPDLIKQTEPA